MKLSNQSAVPVYTISGSNTARPLPEWLARKRRRSLKQDPEFANRVELLQDFEFEEASSCIRISEDGEWVMSTGTYKPQMHVHYLPHLSLSYARHTDTLNHTFQLLSSDYSKSLHLQTDRFLQFHTPQGCHYATRIPRYGRDLQYDRWSAEALIPAVGVNAAGAGEVYRLNLELGRFMKPYEVEVGGDDLNTPGGGALQGGINAGSVNCAAIATSSHGLFAFGTSLGSVEFWDSRARRRVGALAPAPSQAPPLQSGGISGVPAETTCLQFDPSGLTVAKGDSEGIVRLYDLRNPTPYLTKDQGYSSPIQTIMFLAPSSSTSRSAHLESEPKILTADKRIIKIWSATDGSPWTSIEPAVDLNCVAWCPDSGMILTANEGRQQHSFFIPQLGPAPKWCAFLDNLVEEMAEDSNDPGAFGGQKTGEVYDNYKFLTVPQLRQLSLDHLIGQTALLRPYMHGYFVAQQLYEEARLISNPDLWQQQRQKSIREKIEKERESRIRGSKKIAVKVNRKLAERILEREEKNERRKAKRALRKGEESKSSDATVPNPPAEDDVEGADGQAAEGMADSQSDKKPERVTALNDPRFAELFTNPDFEVDEESNEFKLLNPSTKPSGAADDGGQRRSGPRGLTAAEQEALSDPDRRSSDSDAASENEDDDDDDESEDGEGNEDFGGHRRRKQQQQRASAASANNGKPNKFATDGYRKSAKQIRRDAAPKMTVSSSGGGRGAAGGGAGPRGVNAARHASFGARAKALGGGGGGGGGEATVKNRNGGVRGVVGEREISWAPKAASAKGKDARRNGETTASRVGEGGNGGGGRNSGPRSKDRRSASMNTFRKM